MAAAAFAVGTITASGVAVDTQTIVIGGKTYTTQTTLTNVDGNVLIGANAAATLQNLYDAINLTPAGAGVTYAAAMTANPEVIATSVTSTTVVVRARVPGQVGNRIPTTETQTNWAWGGATLASGAGSPDAELTALMAVSQINASVYQQLKVLFGLSN